MTEESLFAAAVALPDPAARAAFLDRACAGNPELWKHLDALVAAHFSAGSVFEPATVSRDPDGTRTGHTEPLGEAGQVIAGRYKLIEPIGEGGMGSVWMAEQREPVKRLVAVKLIKAGMDSKAVLARFEAERQALAVMDHPNIAKVLDGGVCSLPSPLEGEGPGVRGSSPFFVMELVKGTPITAFCDARRLTPRQRLELFVPVCSAIQHAHMKGVIHRDIKPSNVLVALYDDKPIPKVIDFGIAKATGQALTDKTLHTGFGAVVGTPEYMSPEQASLNNLDIDTRSDVYSLGVLLYELLVGSPPFTRRELEQAGLLEMLRVVRETEPQRPSAKLSTAAARPSIAANRGLEPLALAKVLRSELDWLVMKALEKDRNRRYDSANGLAADVGRYLAGEAVTAVPPSLGYRVRKWVRKNRGLVTAAGLVAGTLTVGIAGTTWQAVRAEREAERARGEEQKVRDEQAKTKEALDAAERNLVHSYLRPIGFNTSGFDQAELIALDELARQDDDRVKLLFLREALADGERALRIARRAERVVQAAVGPSLRRRTAALELTSATQRDLSADPRVRLCACWLAIELGSDDLPALKEGFETLLAQKGTDWSNFTIHLPTRIHPSKEVALANVLVAAMAKTTFEYDLQKINEILAAVAPRLDPATANRVADAIGVVLKKTTHGETLRAAMSGLVTLAPQLNPTVAGRVSKLLIALLDTTTGWSVMQAVGDSLSALVPRLDSPLAAQQFDTLIDLVCKTTNLDAPNAAADALIVLIERLDVTDVRRGFHALVRQYGKNTRREILLAVGRVLVAMAPQLGALAAEEGIHALLGVIEKSTDDGVTELAGDNIAALAPWLDPTKRSITSNRGADLLVGIVENKETNPLARRSAVSGLNAIAPHLDRVAAVRAADVLDELLGKTTDSYTLRTAVSGIVALAPRLDAPAAQNKLTRAADAIVRFLGKKPDAYTIETAAEGLTAFAPRLGPMVASKGFDALVGAVGGNTDPSVQESVRKALTILAVRLEPNTAKRTADTLTATLDKGRNENELQSAVEGLAALTPRLEPAVAGRAFDTLLARLVKTSGAKGWKDLWATASGLFALAPRLDPAVARTKLAQATDALVTVIGKTDDDEVLGAATDSLASLALHLDANAAGKGFDALVAGIGKTAPSPVYIGPKNALIALAPRLDSADASRAGNSLEAVQTKILAETQHDYVCDILLELWPRFSQTSRAEFLHRVLRRVSDHDRQSTAGWTNNFYRVGFISCISLVDSIAFLTDLLRDPGCVGEFQSAVLARLEELAYPDPGQAAVFVGLAGDPRAAVTLPAVKQAGDDHRRQHRRFRTVSDAARWLADAHPEIDLDRPYHKAAPGK